MRLLLLLTLCFSLILAASPAFSGTVNLHELQTIQLDSPPKQVTSTADGRRMYVLTQDSKVQIYSLAGDLQGEVAVDPTIDHLTPLGPQHLLLQKTAKNQAVVAMLEVSQQIDISEAPIRGDVNAPVTIAVFDDFECPYCAKAVPLIKQAFEKYPGKVKIAFKNFPLNMHRNSRNAALTALAANKQGKFWEMHDLLYANYNRLNPNKIDELAKQTGVDFEQLKKDRNDPQLNAMITRDIDEGTKAGVRGTPTIFVNGRLLSERSIGAFSRLIEEELRKAPQAAANPQ